MFEFTFSSDAPSLKEFEKGFFDSVSNSFSEDMKDFPVLGNDFATVTNALTEASVPLLHFSEQVRHLLLSQMVNKSDDYLPYYMFFSNVEAFIAMTLAVRLEKELYRVELNVDQFSVPSGNDNKNLEQWKDLHTFLESRFELNIANSTYAKILACAVLVIYMFEIAPTLDDFAMYKTLLNELYGAFQAMLDTEDGEPLAVGAS